MYEERDAAVTRTECGIGDSRVIFEKYVFVTSLITICGREATTSTQRALKLETEHNRVLSELKDMQDGQNRLKRMITNRSNRIGDEPNA